mgnify:FL=1|jgi:hypothetical protein
MNQDSLKTVVAKATPSMSLHDFTEWGVREVAYIKPVEMNGRTVYAIFAANGRQLAVTENLDAAHGLLFQNGLEPQGLH